MDIQKLYARAQEIAPWIVENRRALHRIPEDGFAEHKTQAHITAQLDALGIPYETHLTWTVGTIAGGLPGPTVGLRADMDALPVTEPEGCSFRSTHDGWMHACGHDAHTAILLGAARLLSEMKDALPGTVRLFFQPDEEGEGGAQPMVDAGVMEGISAVYGLHVQPYLNVGHIDTRPGTLNASTDEIRITVHGKSCHASKPHEGIDAIFCMAQIVNTLQMIVSRNVNTLKPAVLTFGKIQGGGARNIICDEVMVFGTLRTADADLRAYMKNRIREIAEGVAAACGATVDVNIRTGYAALVNDETETARVLRLGKALLGDENALLKTEPSMGGEDFSYFLEKAPGAFYHLGCASQQPAAPLHSRDFTIDERCLPIGAALQCALVLDRMYDQEA